MVETPGWLNEQLPCHIREGRQGGVSVTGV
jgi:hypothetical protein